MIVSIASGKGGTGKTTVAVNIALSLENVQLLDCDVEEPNAHIFINPNIEESHFVYTLVPTVDENLCDYCGACSRFCQYHAIVVLSDDVMIFPDLCHSCGGCFIVCPRKAVIEDTRKVGVVKKGSAGDLEFVYGELDVGEAMAIPVIKEVKREIRRDKTVIIDAPPGTSCPVVATVYGSDFCLLVTEPTPFGFHDLEIMVEVLRKIGIPLGVVVNFQGIGDRKVYEYCERENIPILLEIPYNRKIAELYSRGIPFVEEMPEWKAKFRRMINQIRNV